jgi:uncharacterized protein (TIGR00297 family)
VAAGSVAWAGWRGQALTVPGAVAAWLTGTVVTAAGWNHAAAMLAFFVSGSALSRLQGKHGAALTAIWEKGGRRDAAQVAANGGVAVVAALLHIVRPGPLPVAACLGALAASSADTWATEIGVLSTAPPRRITDGRAITTGMSGGVTALGIAGGLAGATFLAGVAVWTQAGPRRLSRLRQFVGLSLAGVGGSLADSLLGATIQASRTCPVCRTATERRIHQCGASTQLTRGYPWVQNDAVNVAATVVGALLAVVWQWRLGEWRAPQGDPMPSVSYATGNNSIDATVITA